MLFCVSKSENGENNWDGSGASAITEKTIGLAEKFLQLLIQSGCPISEIIPEPDGDINFEWYRDSNYLFEVSVSEDEFLHYAGLFEKNIVKGKFSFDGTEIPKLILDQVNQFSRG